MKFNIFKIIVLLSALLIINTVKAEENLIISKINETQKIKGRTYAINSTTKAEIQKYLDTHVLSETETNVIVEDYDEMIEIFKGASTTSWNDLDTGEKTKLSNLISDIDEKTLVKINVDEEGVISIYEPNGELITKIAQVFEETKEEVKEKKEESHNSNYAIVIGGISFIVLVFITNNVVRQHA